MNFSRSPSCPSSRATSSTIGTVRADPLSASTRHPSRSSAGRGSPALEVDVPPAQRQQLAHAQAGERGRQVEDRVTRELTSIARRPSLGEVLDRVELRAG